MCLACLLVPPLAAGGSVVCTPVFSAPLLAPNIREFRPTWMQVVPAMAREILDQCDGRLDAVYQVADERDALRVRSLYDSFA